MRLPGEAKSGREPSKSLPEPSPRGSRTTPERCPNAFCAPGYVEHARGAIFRRFCMVLRKLRCAEIIAPANVLYTSNEVGSDRARTSKKLENQGVSASKIEAGSGRASQNRGSAAQVERQSAIRRAMRSDFFFWKTSASEPSERPRASMMAAKSAGPANALRNIPRRTIRSSRMRGATKHR